MEKCVLVPNRLQDIGPRDQVLKLSHEEDLEDVKGLHDLFLVLKNIKSELTTGEWRKTLEKILRMNNHSPS